MSLCQTIFKPHRGHRQRAALPLKKSDGLHTLHMLHSCRRRNMGVSSLLPHSHGLWNLQFQGRNRLHCQGRHLTRCSSWSLRCMCIQRLQEFLLLVCVSIQLTLLVRYQLNLILPWSRNLQGLKILLPSLHSSIHTRVFWSPPSSPRWVDTNQPHSYNPRQRQPIPY